MAVLIGHGNVTGANATAPTSSGPSQSPQALPAPPGPSSTTPVAPTTAPTVPGTPQGTPEQLARAITDYYALVPANLPVAWDRLTTNYQQNHAGGFTGYQNFWTPVQRVTVFDVSATQGGAVDATIDYVFKDGRVVEERTSYGLIAEDGLWKINSSTVSSSQTK